MKVIAKTIYDACKILESKYIKYTQIVNTVSDNIQQFNNGTEPVAYYYKNEGSLTIVEESINENSSAG